MSKWVVSQEWYTEVPFWNFIYGIPGHRKPESHINQTFLKYTEISFHIRNTSSKIDSHQDAGCKSCKFRVASFDGSPNTWGLEVPAPISSRILHSIRHQILQAPLWEQKWGTFRSSKYETKSGYISNSNNYLVFFCANFVAKLPI